MKKKIEYDREKLYTNVSTLRDENNNKNEV